MAVAFSSPLLGHLKMQGKRLEKLGENTGQILRGRKNDPPTPLQLATNRHRAGLPSLVQKNGPSAGLHAEAVGGCVSGTPKTLVNNTVDCHVSKIPIGCQGPPDRAALIRPLHTLPIVIPQAGQDRPDQVGHRRLPRPAVASIRSRPNLLGPLASCHFALLW